MDFSRRMAGLQAEMSERGLDLVMFGHCPSFQYLTGIPADWRLAPDHRPEGDVVLVPREGGALLVESGAYPAGAFKAARTLRLEEAGGWEAALSDIASGLGRLPRRLGLGAYLPAPAVVAALQAFGHPGTTDASRLLDRMRAVKEPEEIEALRAAARLTDTVMMDVARWLREGVTQREVMLEIERRGRLAGASHVSFSPWACFVRPGSAPVTADVTGYPLDEGLSGPAAITFDVGFVLDGYCSDWGRSLHWGTPSAQAAAAYGALRRAVEDTVAGMGDGAMRACDVYPAIERRLDALGFGDQMRARLAGNRVMGHQIGVEVHENPWLRPDFDEPLREGMVLCVEPKLWNPGEYYLRLEEMVLVGRTGGTFLTQFDRELFGI
ncbi:MAG TPA: Xaa-Pro peptidase family protein [Holophaga sp.]|nr:Xaa-Pro peptidase family protein [Holophaga sp.]HPS66661.1 Xaa-Pro peptidase family protein [Holophaga sp.]